MQLKKELIPYLIREGYIHAETGVSYRQVR